MKSPFVSELEPNRVITTSFLVHSKEIRQKKSGELYISLLLADRTGELDAKMWDNVTEFLEAFDRDDFVKVKGLIQIFHNRPQLTIHKVRRMDDSEIEFADYFPSSKRDPEEMWLELRAIVAGLSNPHLRALLDAMLADPDIAARYRRAPAAKHIHHAFLGGLIEHVLSLCALAKRVAPHYAAIDLDLLLTGVVLHDIGKIYELNYERGFSYSNDGQLVGHIAIALRMLADKLRTLPDFPPRLRVLVEHLILSHHGHLEFGSPKVPQFPEALMLHYLDDLDSKMECMRALVQNDRQLDGCFTSYSSTLERTVLKMDRYWAEETPAPPRAPAAVSAADEFGPTTPAAPRMQAVPTTKPAVENGPAQHAQPARPAVENAPAQYAPAARSTVNNAPVQHAQPARPAVENVPAQHAQHAQPARPAFESAPAQHAQPARPAVEYAPAQHAPAAKPPVEKQAPAQHALFISRPESPFADKLRQALKPAVTQERTEQQVAE